MQNDFEVAPEAAKREWVRPELHRIEAGSAESGRLAVGDSGGGAQAS